MSQITAGAIASCKIKNIRTVLDAARMYYDHCVESQDAPEELPQDDKFQFIDVVKSYLSVGITGGIPTLLIEYETDTSGLNTSSSVFDSLSSYFATVQDSQCMRVKWWVNDSREGMDFGIDYYDSDNNQVNVDDAVYQYLKLQNN